MMFIDTVASVTARISPENTRLRLVASDIADESYIKGGLDGMRAELAFLRRSEAHPVIISAVERMYHQQIKRLLPAQK